jgi:hypothetical protein
MLYEHICFHLSSAYIYLTNITASWIWPHLVLSLNRSIITWSAYRFSSGLVTTFPYLRFLISGLCLHWAVSHRKHSAKSDELFSIHSLRELTAECLIATIITFMYVPRSGYNRQGLKAISSQLYFIYQLYIGMRLSLEWILSSDAVLFTSKEPWKGNLGVLGYYCNPISSCTIFFNETAGCLLPMCITSLR